MPAAPVYVDGIRGRRLQGSEGVLPTDWLLGTPTSQQSSEAFVSSLQAIGGHRFRGVVPLVRPESAVAPAAPPRAAPASELEILPLSADSPPESSSPPQPSIAQPPPPGKERPGQFGSGYYTDWNGRYQWITGELGRAIQSPPPKDYTWEAKGESVQFQAGSGAMKPPEIKCVP